MHSTPIYHIYWHDTEQTILILHFHAQWEWSDINEAISLVNLTIDQQIEATGKPMYVIGTTSAGGTILPSDTNALSYILQLIKIDPSGEELSFFVIDNNLLRKLIHTAMKVYDTIVANRRYIFVYSVEEALKIIEKHQQEYNQ